MMQSTSLDNIPTEILYLIIQSVDPISLVNLSQTSTFLRWLINPKLRHFVQRLLALELIPEHGGIVPLFRARDNTISPPIDSQEWDRNKYACAGCMKLLPHQMFDNHSVLGLGLRKPPPESEEVDKVTDWEPEGDEVARWKRWQSREPAKRERLEVWHQQYVVAIRSHRQWGLNGFVAVPEDDVRDDALAAEAEKVICGRLRHKRLCIECKRKRGVYTKQCKSNIGGSEVPIIKSRKLAFKDDLSRCFPRTIYPDIPEPPSPRIFRVQHPGARLNLITTHMVFCRHCSTWQELPAFRIRRSSNLPMRNDVNSPIKDKLLSELCCNHCFSLEHGAQKLRIELFWLFKEKADETLDMIRRRLKFGWERIPVEFCQTDGTLNQHKYKATLNNIFDPGRNGNLDEIQSRFEHSCEYAYGAIQDDDPYDYRHKVTCPEDSSVEERLALRRRVKHFRRFLDKEADPADRHEVTDSWQGSWLEDYEDNETCLFYTLEILVLIKANPWLLVHYALHPARFRYPRSQLTTQQLKIVAQWEEARHKLAMEWSANRLPYYRQLVKKGKPWRIHAESHNNQVNETEECDEDGEDSDEFMDEHDELGREFDTAMNLRGNKGRGKWRFKQ